VPIFTKETLQAQRVIYRMLFKELLTLTLSPERQSLRMSKITNDDLTWSGNPQDAL